MYENVHISPPKPHRLGYKAAARSKRAAVRQVRLTQKKEGFRMEDKMILPRPQQPEGKGDLDDWIFRGDSWIISDR